MKRITVTITDAQHELLKNIMDQDAASNQSEAVQWALDCCRRIEKNYDEQGPLDACYVAFHDIRDTEHPRFDDAHLQDPEMLSLNLQTP